MKYKAVLKVNPQNRTAPPKYYAVPVYIGDISLKRISTEIALSSSLSAGDVYNVLSNFTTSLPKYLKDGFKLHLGDFGIFKASFSSEGMDDPKQITSAHIRNKKILYTPSKDIKAQMDDMQFSAE
jgi:predicted histone-like DNA-binding protein